jgi:drug/metabolite transporter (DMT)-like permease
MYLKLRHSLAQRFDAKQIAGTLLVLVGSVGFASKAIIAKLMYRYDVDTVSLLSIRMGFSSLFFMLIISTKPHKQILGRLNRKEIWLIVGMGFIGYYLSSLFDFWGLRYVSAGLERLILFIYPTIVVVVSAIIYKRPVKQLEIISLLLTYIGIGLAMATDFSAKHEYFWLGAGLIFMAALTYSFYLIGSEHILPKVGSVVYTSYVMLIATIAVLIQFLLVHGITIPSFPNEVYQLGFLMSIIATVAPAFMITKGIKLIGAGNAAIVGSIGPVSTILLANIFLDEPILFWQITGTVFVVAGVLIVGLRKKKSDAAKPSLNSPKD